MRVKFSTLHLLVLYLFNSNTKRRNKRLQQFVFGLNNFSKVTSLKKTVWFFFYISRSTNRRRIERSFGDFSDEFIWKLRYNHFQQHLRVLTFIIINTQRVLLYKHTTRVFFRTICWDKTPSTAGKTIPSSSEGSVTFFCLGVLWQYECSTSLVVVFLYVILAWV